MHFFNILNECTFFGGATNISYVHASFPPKRRETQTKVHRLSTTVQLIMEVRHSLCEGTWVIQSGHAPYIHANERVEQKHNVLWCKNKFCFRNPDNITRNQGSIRSRWVWVHDSCEGMSVREKKTLWFNKHSAKKKLYIHLIKLWMTKYIKLCCCIARMRCVYQWACLRAKVNSCSMNWTKAEKMI